jgi:uncharacterized protein
VDVTAIDFHTHPQTEEMLRAKGRRGSQMGRYFNRERKVVTFDAMAEIYRSRRMAAVILNSDDETTSGIAPASNNLLADAAQRHPDVFIPFAGIDPWKGAVAIREIARCDEELGVRGIGELNPGRQHFHPNDPRFYPIWEECQARGLIVLFHTGFLGAGAGTPGGMGFKLKYTRPIPGIDDVAADFPELRIVAAHPAWPWQSEALAIARHKTNVWIDLSGWAPKYFSPELVQYANSLISDRVLFGTDWPAIDIDRYMREFGELPLKADVRPKILVENARRLLGLAADESGAATRVGDSG